MIDSVAREIINAMKYDPERGTIHWRVPGHGRRMGIECGCIKSNKHYRYRAIKFQGVEYTAARIAWTIMTGKVPDFIINPKDGNSINIKWSNLQRGDKGVSQRNRRRIKKTSSGRTGVSPSKKGWEAYIGDGKGGKIYLGVFESFEGAERAREAEEIKRGYGKAHGLQPA